MSQFDPNLESEQKLLGQSNNLYANINSSNGSSGHGSRNTTHANQHAHQHANHHVAHSHLPDVKSRRTKHEGGDGYYSPGGPLPSSATDQITALQEQVSKLLTRLYTVAIVAVVGILILLILGSVFLPILFHKLATHSHRPGLGAQVAAFIKDGLCLPCKDFKLGPSPEEESLLDPYRDEREGSSQCCVDTPAELMDILKLYIQRQFRLELAKGTVNTPWSRPVVSKDGKVKPIKGPRPAAHFMMIRQNQSNYDDVRGKIHAITKWLHKGDMAFSVGGAYHQHGRIVVPRDGYYYVYSQISFMDYTPRSGRVRRSHDNEEPSLSIYLYRYNILYDKGGQEILAQNSITKCWGQNKTYEEYTSNLGAVFFLRQKDEIFIKVSNISMLVTNPKSSYLGFFMI